MQQAYKLHRFRKTKILIEKSQLLYLFDTFFFARIPGQTWFNFEFESYKKQNLGSLTEELAIKIENHVG